MAQVAEEIFSSAPCFYEKAMRDADVWFRNILDDERDRYLWSRREGDSFAARESSLFHKHKPVVSYGYDELDEPMHNGTVSMWEMCSGLLGNVHFTLPLAKNSRGQYVPTTLLSQTSSYSPYTPSTTPNVTSLESFILQVNTRGMQKKNNVAAQKKKVDAASPPFVPPHRYPRTHSRSAHSTGTMACTTWHPTLQGARIMQPRPSRTPRAHPTRSWRSRSQGMAYHSPSRMVLIFQGIPYLTSHIRSVGSISHAGLLGDTPTIA